MPRLLEVADLCSRTLSDPANRLRKTRKKKSSAVPPFRSGHMSAICARLSKGKGRFTRGWKPQVSTLLCARAASAQVSTLLCPCRAGKISSLRKRYSAILHLNAKEEHCCLAVSLFAHITGFCFPDFSAVQHWPHGGALLRSPEALSPALQRTRVSPGRCAYARDSRSYPRTGRAFSADD